MARIRYVLLLPLTYNDKSKVPKKVRQQIFDDLFRLAGGHHIAGVGEGAYRMKSGKKKVDRSLEVWVAIEESDEEALKAMVAEFAAILGQESIYFEKVNSEIEFIPPKSLDRETS